MDGIFFYKDPTTGKRRPLPFFYGMLMVIGFLLVLVLVGLYIVRDKQTLLTPPTSSSSVSLATNTPAPTATDTPIPTATWTPAPTEDPWAVKRQALLQRINDCEKDPKKWTFEDVPYGYGRWKRIVAPGCVLDSLARTVAWTMLVYGGGYSFEEAAQVLGFQRFPALYRDKDNNSAGFPFKNPKGVWQAEGHNTTLYHPELRVWMLDRDGNVSLPIFTPRGCYLARHLLGGIWREWTDWYNAPYLAQCFLYSDEIRYFILVKGPQGVIRFDMTALDVAPEIRHSYLFGYDPDRGWYLLDGYLYDERFRYTPKKMGVQQWPPEGDYQQIRQIWKQDVVWGAKWLQETWGLSPKPLPESEQIQEASTREEWRAFWRPLVKYFRDEWPQRHDYFWSYQNPPANRP